LKRCFGQSGHSSLSVFGQFWMTGLRKIEQARTPLSRQRKQERECEWHLDRAGQSRSDVQPDCYEIRQAALRR
jgi:hypothetical protein